MSSLLAKVAVLTYDSVATSKTVALKTYYRSVRLIKDAGWVNPTQPSYITNILLCGNCIDPEERNLYVFYIDTFFGSAWIIEINIDSRVQKVVYYDKNNDIGFDPMYKIYNPRVVHGRLIWTDNKNDIYQMDIKRAKRSFSFKIGYGQYPNTSEWSSVYPYGIDQIVSNGNNFYKNLVDNNLGTEPKFDDGTNWEKLCLIEDAYYSMNVENFYFAPMPPKMPPEVSYQSDDSRKINNLRQTLFQFAYRYVYMDWRKSTFSPASIVPVPQAEEGTATGLASEQISLNNKFQIAVNSGGEEVRAIDIIGRSSDDPSKWYLIETINKFGEQERGNELSRTSEPGYITVAITLPQPTVTGTNIVNGVQRALSMAILTPAVDNTYVNASVLGMQWTAEEYGSGFAKTTVMDCNPFLATLISKPDWLSIFSQSGYSLIAGMTVQNAETLSIYPNERPTASRAGYIVIRNIIGDFVTLITTQSGDSEPPHTPIIPTMSIDPNDSSGMEITGSSCGALSNDNNVTYSLVVNHPAYEDGELFDVHWRCVVTREGVPMSFGYGVLTGIADNIGNTGALVLDANLNEGDVVVIYLSSQAFLGSIVYKIPMALGILNPNAPINSWIASEKLGMQWQADEGGVENADSTLITAPPMNCTITTKPSWITIQGVAGYNLYEGWTIQNGETIAVFPTEDNLGSPRSAFIVLTNAYGDSCTIIVSQASSVTPPVGVPVACTVQVYSGDSTGLTLPGSSASAFSGNKNILWSALVAHTAHTDDEWTMYWRAKVNDIVQGSGSFTAYVGSNTGEIVLDVTLLAGDVVVIDFSSVTF